MRFNYLDVEITCERIVADNLDAKATTNGDELGLNAAMNGIINC
jgi:hypothetical protein